MIPSEGEQGSVVIICYNLPRWNMFMLERNLLDIFGFWLPNSQLMFDPNVAHLDLDFLRGVFDTRGTTSQNWSIYIWLILINVYIYIIYNWFVCCWMTVNGTRPTIDTLSDSIRFYQSYRRRNAAHTEPSHHLIHLNPPNVCHGRIPLIGF